MGALSDLTVLDLSRLLAGPFCTQTLSDLGAAVGWEHSDDDQPFINTDVTLQLLRPPQSEWILFESDVQRVSNNLACCRTTLTDLTGPLGWVLQSQMVAPDTLQF